jgi:fructuronate reductase
MDTEIETASTPRLNAETLVLANSGVSLPQYHRNRTTIGVVHLGPGAFHRGHQACYFDSLLEHDSRWAISGVELMGAGLAGEAVQQDHLYVVAQLDAQTRYRVVGSHKEYLKAQVEPDKVFARMLDPNVRLVSMTVTEKGYCLDGAGVLDLQNSAILADLKNPTTPTTLVGWVTEGLARRKAAKMAPFIPLSCDNMMMNGHKLHAAVLRYADARGDHELCQWIGDNVVFPSTMVDSITPAATDELKDRIAVDVGLRDEAPVQREAFVQWVVEDILGEGAPDLGSVGVTLTRDVAAYELAKLRLLNGAHTTLAYAGLMRGHDSVGAAMNDLDLSRTVERMMRQDIVPTLRKAPGFDFYVYVSHLLARFRNPALTHKLSQIASDGSQKLPYRVLEPLQEAMKDGRSIRRFAISLGAWMRFVVQQTNSCIELNDPLRDKLSQIGKACVGDAVTDVPMFLALREVFPADLVESSDFRAAVYSAYDNFEALLEAAP